MHQRQVSFSEAVTSALQLNYCNFSGRASRSEYWWYILFTNIIAFGVGFILGLLTHSETAVNIGSGILYLILLLPGLGLMVRRLHDIGKSGWGIFIAFIPIVGGIILLVWMCTESEPETNKYGPVPNLVAE